MNDDSMGPVTAGTHKIMSSRGTSNRGLVAEPIAAGYLGPACSLSNPMDESFNYADRVQGALIWRL